LIDKLEGEKALTKGAPQLQKHTRGLKNTNIRTKMRL